MNTIKPPISAIPTKDLVIYGKTYRTYQLIKISTIVARGKEYHYLRTQFNGRYKKVCLKQYENVFVLKEKRELVRKFVNKTLQLFQDFVEENYVGDKCDYKDWDESYSIGKVNPCHNYVVVRYGVQGIPGEPKHYIKKIVGKEKEITPEDIKRVTKECMTVQRLCNERYNKLLSEKRRAFQQLVRQQIEERNALVSLAPV